MGEIAEALRRAGQRRGRTAPGPAPASPGADGRRPARTPAPGADVREHVRIGDQAEGSWVGRAVHVDQRGAAAEHYRHFALRLLREIRTREARSVLLTSAARAEGTTTTACNLALALATMSGGRRLALVELDLRRPSIARALDVSPAAGIEEVLAGRAELGDALLGTDLADLDLCLARRPAERPLELLSGPALPSLIRELTRLYDLVLIDTPPVLPVPDVPLILPHVAAAVVVARAGRSRRGGLDTLVETLGRDKLLGVFLNEAAISRRMRYYGYYGYEADDAPADAEQDEAREARDEARGRAGRERP